MANHQADPNPLASSTRATNHRSCQLAGQLAGLPATSSLVAAQPLWPLSISGWQLFAPTTLGQSLGWPSNIGK